MILTEARNLLIDSGIHTTSSAFDAAKQDRAIRDACDHFMREVPCSTATTTISLAAGDSTNTFSGITNFGVGKFIEADISNRPVKLVHYRTVIRRFDNATPTGQPGMVGFSRDNLGQFDKQCDAAYSLDVTHWKQQTTFTVGTTAHATTSLDIPDEWVQGVIRFGARAYLIMGAPGHKDWPAALNRFNLLVEDAKKAFQINRPEAWNSIPMAGMENSRRSTPTRRRRK
jgi:hypothetical protein